jgi:hypothetical protein
MNRLLAALFLASLFLSGCSSEQEQVLRDGHGVNLSPTPRESRAGY